MSMKPDNVKPATLAHLQATADDRYDWQLEGYLPLGGMAHDGQSPLVLCTRVEAVRCCRERLAEMPLLASIHARQDGSDRGLMVFRDKVVLTHGWGMFYRRRGQDESTGLLSDQALGI